MDKKPNLHFFNSLKDEADHVRKESARLSPLERLQHMRLLIAMAYSMPNGELPKAPQHHTLNRIQHEYFR